MAARPRPLVQPGRRGPGLRLATHNVRGFFYSGPPAVNGWAGARPQRTKMHDLMFLWGRVLNLDIVCVQESHIDVQNPGSHRSQAAVEDALGLAATDLHVPGYTCFWDHGPTGRQGVGILIRTCLLTPEGVRVDDVVRGGDGRRLVAPIRWSGHSFSLLNLYLPPAGQSAFVSDVAAPWLALHVAPTAPAVFVGDLNMTFAPGHIDWLPGLGELGDAQVGDAAQARQILDYTHAPARALMRACTRAGLQDCYRHKHPHTRTFSCLHYARCRLLDRIFVSAALLPHVESCSVDFRTVSDHRPVVMCLRPAVAVVHRRAPHPRLRLDFARHPRLRTALTEWGEKMAAAAPTDPAALITWWSASFKPAMAAQVRALNAQAKQQQPGGGSVALQSADAELCAAMAQFEAQAGTTAESVRRVTTAKAAYVRALAALTDPMAARAQFAWLHEHERVGRQMKGVMSKPRSAFEIAALRTPAGVLLTQPHAIATALAHQYASVSTAPAPSPARAPATALVIAAVSAHAPLVAPDLAGVAGAETVSEREVKQAMAGMARGRAPGPDGFPAHLWRLGGAPFLLLLVALFSAIGKLHSTPTAFTHGIVVPIYKGGDSVLTLAASYRPITLLNTDYRILSRILCARFTAALDGAVPLEQTAFLPGRLIGDAILFMQLLPAALRAQARSRSADQPAAGVVAFLDFAKAFDTVDRDFLCAVMQAVGMGGSVHWVRTLLADCQAVCVANGAASDALLWEAGVRQGCPLSPPLYLFVAWALTAWLHTQPSLGLRVGGTRHVCSQFADDTKALLASLALPAVQPFVDCMATFGDASGQRLNLGKCALMRVGALGSEPVPATVCGMKVVTSEVALGVVCSNDDTPPKAAYWEGLLGRVRNAYGRLSRLRLSTMGRGLGASCYGVSTLLYHAEFMGPLPPRAATALHAMSSGLVDRDQAPAERGMPPGIPSALLSGSPSAGGFGLLAWSQHITARHAVWACRLLTFLSLQGRRGGMTGLPVLTARHEKLTTRLADPDLQPLPRAKLQKELSMLNAACDRCAPWMLLAAPVLRDHRPAYHPAFSLLDMAARGQPDNPALSLPELALPPALRRMVLALRLMGIPAPVHDLPPAPGPWVAAAPLWGNPLLRLERPRRDLPAPVDRPWAEQPQVVEWVRAWGARGFEHLATPALLHVSNLRNLRTRVVAPAWRDLTRQGGDGLWRALWGERMIDLTLMLHLNYYTPHACLAGVDALWEALPVAWRALAADPAAPAPSAALQQDAVARVLDVMAWTPVGQPRLCIHVLGGSTVKLITAFLTHGIQAHRHSAWLAFASAALAPCPPAPVPAPVLPARDLAPVPVPAVPPAPVPVPAPMLVPAPLLPALAPVHVPAVPPAPTLVPAPLLPARDLAPGPAPAVPPAPLRVPAPMLVPAPVPLLAPLLLALAPMHVHAVPPAPALVPAPRPVPAPLLPARDLPPVPVPAVPPAPVPVPAPMLVPALVLAPAPPVPAPALLTYCPSSMGEDCLHAGCLAPYDSHANDGTCPFQPAAAPEAALNAQHPAAAVQPPAPPQPHQQARPEEPQPEDAAQRQQQRQQQQDQQHRQQQHDGQRRLEAQGRADAPGPLPLARPLAPPVSQLGQRQPQPAPLLQPVLVPWVGRVLRAAWRLPWHNVHKDTLWRMTVQGVQWAGGHGLAPVGRACGCGWAPARALPVEARAAAWQEHCFWSCPVAQAVVAEVVRGLPPALWPVLHRSHVWLLHSPADHIVSEVWHVVCLAALSAMRFGMRVLYARQRAAEEEQAENAGLRQATLEELWGGMAQVQHIAPGASVLVSASRRAAGEFWAMLGEFVSVHDGSHTWDGAKGLPVGHAYIASRLGVPGSLRLRLPH